MGRKTQKNLSKSGGAETNDGQSEYCQSIPDLDPLSPKESDPVLLPKSQPVAEKNEAIQVCAEPESATPRKKRKRKNKNLSVSEGIKTNNSHSEHRELIHDLDKLPLKDSNSVMLLEPETFPEKNNTNQLCTEPESATPRKKRWRGKRKSLSNSEGVELSHVDSEQRELCPNLVVLSPKDPDPLMLPEPAPVGEKNVANQLCTKPDSTSPKFEGAQIKDMDSGSVPPNDLNFVLLPEPESFTRKNNTNQLCSQPESVTPRKKRRRGKGKGKSLSNSEGVEVSHVNSEHLELYPNLVVLSPNDPESLLLPKPAPVGEKNEANQLCIKPDCNSEPQSVTPRKKRRKGKGKGKGKRLSNNEGVEVNHANSEHRELCPNLVVLSPKDPEALLLPKPAPVGEKDEATQLGTKPDSASPKFEGAEIKDVDSGLMPPKDLNFVLFPETESFAGKNDSDQLCTEPELVTPRKKRRKGRKKSLTNSGGAELSHVDSGQRELCHDLAVLSPKDPDPLLLPKPALIGEKREANKLCTKFDWAERKDMDFENLELCPKLDPLPTKDSDPQLLPESEPAPLKGVDQDMKRKNKNFEGDGAESSRPHDEHSQQCHKAKPMTPEEQNQRKRQAKNETYESSDQPMVNPNHVFGSRGIIISAAVRGGPWIPKGPLKDYERYERCLECRQICQRDQTCRRLKGRHHDQNTQICFFCGSPGHIIGRCPKCPGVKCAEGKIMVNDYVRKQCHYERTRQQIAL